jgi:uncharacterized protein (TIGR02246 family)
LLSALGRNEIKFSARGNNALIDTVIDLNSVRQEKSMFGIVLFNDQKFQHTMKKLNLILFALAIAFVACQQPQIQAAPPKPIDFDAAKKEVTAILDDYHGSMKSKDASKMADLFLGDVLFCGTDPNELWDKEAFSDYFRQAFADTAVATAYTVERRKVRVSKDGTYAIAMEQFIDPSSPKILVRVVSHLVKDSVSWKIDFSSWALVPNNDVLSKINEAVAQQPEAAAEGQ